MATGSKATVMLLLLECGVRADVPDSLGNTVTPHAAVARGWDLLELLLEWPGVLIGIENLGNKRRMRDYVLCDVVVVKPFDSEWSPCYLSNHTSTPDNATPQSTKNDANGPPNSHDESIQRLSALLLANRLDMFTELIANNRLNLQGTDRENGTILHGGKSACDTLPPSKSSSRGETMTSTSWTVATEPRSNVAAAVSTSTDPAVIRLLLGDPRMDSGCTALRLAVTGGNYVSAEALLTDPGNRFSRLHLFKSRRRWTARRPCTSQRFVPPYHIVLCLTKSEINDMPIDDRGRTPLHLAVEAGNSVIIRILLKRYARRPDSLLPRSQGPGGLLCTLQPVAWTTSPLANSCTTAASASTLAT
ncbi:hypothetical protein HOY80DRAFT_999694 [Tuber brumale]|nr:hypothetical protein HOY80DRAFT_999694 [Tuber brumale]